MSFNILNLLTSSKQLFIKTCFFISVLSISLFPKVSQAEEFIVAIEHADTELYAYAISLLKLALNDGEDKHTLKIMEYPELSHGRIFDEMLTENTQYNVVISGLHQKRVAKGHIVKVPISRGLLGHRLLVIKKSNIELLDSINDLDSLKKNVSIGSGYGWIDTKVLKREGFKIEVAGYQQLWMMLSKNRFTGFNRGMHEAFSEVSLYDDTYPELMVYPHIMLKYKFDYFFYTKNEKLRSILERKLTDIYEKGLFMEHFESHPQITTAFKSLDFSRLDIYSFNNSFLPDLVKDIPRSYWHDIQSNK